MGWEELDDEPEALRRRAAATNEQLAALMRERARLESEHKRLLGSEPPSDEEMREQARFPMPIHTAESRMEDRALAREKERARAAASARSSGAVEGARRAAAR